MTTSVPGVMPNQEFPPDMNTVTTLMMTMVMAAVATPRANDAFMRVESCLTTSLFATSNSDRS